ncbi:hypothetical protein HQ533_04125 [Candidatus Woesearchaeota archaeon]|nr:hypothetical protein [Candidatus Woesearchaeota archaeon]
MLDPTPSIQELHLTFVLWKKLLGENSGNFDHYNDQLEEYEDTFSEGINTQVQLGRIHDVRTVGDCKTYGDSFFHKHEGITYIRAGLPYPDEEMDPYEDLFNEYSQKLRVMILVDGVNPTELVNNQLLTANKLSQATHTLINDNNPQQALVQYRKLSHLSEQPRSLSIERILNDNFALEQVTGLTITQKASEDSSYYSRFLKRFDLKWVDFMDENQEKYFRVSEMLCDVNYDSNSWKHSYDMIRKEITSKEDINNPLVAACLMQNIVNERKAIYTKDVIALLNSTDS